MWEPIVSQFDEDSPERAVVECLIQRGLSVDSEGSVNADGLDIALPAVAEVVGVPGEVVEKTVDTIVSDPELRGVFQNLSVLPYLEEASPGLGLSVVTVQVDTADESGLLSSISEVFERHDIMIRQAMVEDPHTTEHPQFVAILESTVPSELIVDLETLCFTTGVFYSSYGDRV